MMRSRSIMSLCREHCVASSSAYLSGIPRRAYAATVMVCVSAMRAAGHSTATAASAIEEGEKNDGPSAFTNFDGTKNQDDDDVAVTSRMFEEDDPIFFGDDGDDDVASSSSQTTTKKSSPQQSLSKPSQKSNATTTSSTSLSSSSVPTSQHQQQPQQQIIFTPQPHDPLAMHATLCDMLSDFQARVDDCIRVQNAALTTLATNIREDHRDYDHPIVQSARKLVLDQHDKSKSRQEEEEEGTVLNLPRSIVPPLAALGGARHLSILNRVLDPTSGGIHVVGGDFVMDSETNALLTEIASDCDFQTPLWFFHPSASGGGPNSERQLLVPKRQQVDLLNNHHHNNNKNSQKRPAGPFVLPATTRVMHYSTLHTADRWNRLGALQCPVVMNIEQMLPTLTSAVPERALASMRMKLNDTAERVQYFRDEWEYLQSHFLFTTPPTSTTDAHNNDDVTRDASSSSACSSSSSFVSGSAFFRPTRRKHYLRSLVRRDLAPSVAQHHVLVKLGIFPRHAMFAADAKTAQVIREQAGATMTKLWKHPRRNAGLLQEEDQTPDAAVAEQGDKNHDNTSNNADVWKVNTPPELNWFMEMRDVSRNNEPRRTLSSYSSSSSSSSSPSSDEHASESYALGKELVRRCCWEVRLGQDDDDHPASSSSSSSSFSSNKPPPPTSLSTSSASAVFNWCPINLDTLRPLFHVSRVLSEAEDDNDKNIVTKPNTDNEEVINNQTRTKKKNNTITALWIRRLYLSSDSPDPVVRHLAGCNTNTLFESEEKRFSSSKAPTVAGAAALRNTTLYNSRPKTLSLLYKHKTFSGTPIHVMLGQHLERATVARMAKINDAMEQHEQEKMMIDKNNNAKKNFDEDNNASSSSVGDHGYAQLHDDSSSPSSSPSSSSSLSCWNERVWWPITALAKRNKRVKHGAEVVKFLLEKGKGNTVLVTFVNDVDVEDTPGAVAEKLLTAAAAAAAAGKKKPEGENTATAAAA